MNELGEKLKQDIKFELANTALLAMIGEKGVKVRQQALAVLTDDADVYLETVYYSPESDGIYYVIVQTETMSVFEYDNNMDSFFEIDREEAKEHRRIKSIIEKVDKRYNN